MTRLLTKLALGLSLATGLIVATAAASAEVRNNMTVTVPFPFAVGKASFPAGTYSIQTSENFLRITDVNTNKTSVTVVRSNWGEASHGSSRLTFYRRYGQTYLTKVWIDEISTQSELISHPKPRREIGQTILPDATFEIATK
jgi:hypothetical protein